MARDLAWSIDQSSQDLSGSDSSASITAESNGALNPPADILLAQATENSLVPANASLLQNDFGSVFGWHSRVLHASGAHHSDAQNPTVTWTVDTDGDWGTSSNWSTGQQPGSTDIVGINTTDLHTVTFSTGTSTVQELDVGNDNFTVSGGSLTISGEASFANALTISGGTLSIVGAFTSTTVNDTGSSAGLFFSGSETVDNVTINLGNSSWYLGSTLGNSGAGTLTLGAHAVINQAGLYAWLGDSGLIGVGKAAGAIVNDGSINAQIDGGQFEINSSSFINAGSITISGGDTLSVDGLDSDMSGSFTNTGTISVDGTSRLYFGSELTTAQLGSIDAAAGATLDFAGILNNAGATFAIASGVIYEGEIDGGTVTGAINLTANSGNSDILTFGGGAIVNGVESGIVNITGTGAQLNFNDSETVDNVTINIGDSYRNAAATLGETGGGTLTLGSHATVNQVGSYAIVGGSSSAVVVNDGAINAGSSSGGISIDSSSFTNAGVVAIYNSDSMDVLGNFTNSGSISVTGGGTLYLDGTYFSNTGTISVDGTSKVDIGHELTTAQFDTIIAAPGATLSFGMLDNAGTTFNLAPGVVYEGEIDGGTVTGAINLTQSYQSLTFGSEAVITRIASGTIDITGNSATLTFNDSEILDNVTVNLGASSGAFLVESDDTSPGATLTLGANAAVNQVGSDAGFSGAFINQGSILADYSGGTFYMDDMSNAGTVTVSNGDTLLVTNLTNTGSINVDGASEISLSYFTNTGTINIDGTSKVFFFETLTTAQLGTINTAAGATLDFYGTLNNAGTAFDIPVGDTVLGEIDGGTITGAINLLANNDTLRFGGGAVVQAEAFANNGWIGVTNKSILYEYGSTVNNIGSIYVDGTSQVYFGSDLTTAQLHGVTAEAGAILDFAGTLNNTGSTFELSGVTVLGEIDGGSVTCPINLSASNDTLTFGGGAVVQAATFTNDGTIDITGGSVVYERSSTFSNTGTISVDGTSELDFSSALTTAKLGSIDAASGATLDFAGVLNNAGATFKMVSGVIYEGAIDGGTIAGVVNLGNNDSLTFAGGAVFTGAGGTGAGTINDTGSNSVLSFIGVETINNVTINLGNAGSWDYLGNSGSGTVTFGANAVIDQTGTYATIGSSGGNGAIANDGSIVANISGGQFHMTSSSFTNAGNITVTNGDTLYVDNSFTNTGSLTVNAGELALDCSGHSSGSISVGAGALLDFNGGGSAIFNIINALTTMGSLELDSGVLNTNTLTVDQNLIVDGGTLSLGGTGKVLGALTMDGGTLTLGNTLALNGSGSIIEGTIAGSGTLSLSGGNQSFGSGANLTVSHWTMSGTDVATIDENLNYAGKFTSATTSTLTVASGDTFATSGASTLRGMVDGGGIVTASNATVSNLAIGGSLNFDDTGTIRQTGTVQIGDASGNAATLTISAGDTYKLENNSSITVGASASSVIDDGGLFVKSDGSWISKIFAAIVDTGKVEVATGTLDLAAGVSGTGALQVNAHATLELDSTVASSLSVVMNGTGATLALSHPSAFAATIGGFATSDTIDLLHIAATSASINSIDQLVIMNGSAVVAALQLSGNYSGDTFSVASDHRGGTDITTNAPAAPAFTPHTPSAPEDMFSFAGSQAATIASPSAFDLSYHDAFGVAAELHALQSPYVETFFALEAHSAIGSYSLALHGFGGASDWHFV